MTPNAIKVSLGQTLVSIGINKGWSVVNNEIIWDKSYNGKKPSKTSILKKQKELQDKRDNEQYKNLRAMAYPTITDQLDMIYHDIKDGNLNESSRFFKSINDVKNKYPKELK